MNQPARKPEVLALKDLHAQFDYRAVLDAIDRSQAVIEFDVKGNVVQANTIFLDAMGYTLEEVVGQHHRVFCKPDYAGSAEYANFWVRLGQGKPDTGSTPASPRTAVPFGCKPHTTLYWTKPATLPKW